MKIKIGVFFGGQSVEHEVSIISAIQAINFFDKEKYEIVPIYITKENYMYVGEDIKDIGQYEDINKLISKSQRVVLVKNEDKFEVIKYPLKKFGNNVYNCIDIAFPIVHGTNVEDGSLQGYFKTLNIPFVGCDVLSSAIGMDKYVMKTVLKDNNIPVLDCICFNLKDYNENLDEIVNKVEAKMQYPVIVKPINLGSSVGIRIARDKESLLEAIDYGFKFATRILIETAITNLKEVNCSVLGDYETAIASECEEPINSDEILSYQDKYLPKETTEGSKGMSSLERKLPADISIQMKKDIQELAIKTFQILGCNGVSRIDFIIDKSIDKVYVNEINTIPGSLSFYLWNATSVGYAELLDRMVNLSLKRSREEKNILYSFDTNILSGIKLGGAKGSKNKLG